MLKTYRDHMGLNVVHVEQISERFFSALAGVTEPENKRKIIGEVFVRVFEEEAKKPARSSFCRAPFTPTASKVGMGEAATIKSHHNVGGLPEDSCFKGESSSR